MRLEKSFAAGNPCVQSGRQDAALYGRPEARRYASPFQGFHSFCSLTQGGARFTSLALGYHLSGFQPFQVEPPHVGCHGLKSAAFAFTAESILISVAQGRLKPSPGNFFVASIPSLLAMAVVFI